MHKVVIVGSTGDIGHAIHERLEHESVISFSKSKSSNFNNVHYFLDLTQPLSEADLKQYFARIDVIDALIYTPGVPLFKMLEDTTLNEIDQLYNIFVRNLMTFTKVLLPKLRQSHYGRIIVISSVWGSVGASFESVYATMKGAEEAFVKSLSKELARTSITVNAIAPGVVRGHMTDGLSDEDLKILIEELPQQRFIDPSEVAHGVMYLLDQNSQSVTGEIMKINGGWFT